MEHGSSINSDENPADYHPSHQFVVDPQAENNDDDLEQGERLQLVRTVTSNHNDVLARLETLSRELSKRTASDGEIKIDPEDFDLQRILQSISHVSHRQGVKPRYSGISFENLTLNGIDQSFSLQPTIGDILKGPVSIVRNIKAAKNTPHTAVLKNFNGYAKKGEMVLALGRPGAGCSSLLKALSGTDLDLYTGLEGDIEYDGIPHKEMLKSFKSDLIYNPELDTHFPHLTVEETLKFAIACKTPRLRVNDVSRNDFINAGLEILATVFGLRHTYHTKVGNDFVRGISGGERKRVSIAEALACRGSIYCWDNATRGLDASTALEYARAIRTSTNLLKTTAFVTIYQAGENIYEVFDKVTVLYKGRQVYFGPAKEAKAYFENMGFQCPPRQSTAEFLTAVTDPIGRFPKPGFENKVPNTADEFEDYWLNSPEFKRLQQEIADYKSSVAKDHTKDLYHQSIKQEKMKGQRKNSKFTINYMEQLKLCTIRGFQNIKGDKAYTVTKVLAALCQGLIAGSLYYNTPETVTGAFSRGGVVFFAALYVSLMSLAEVSAAFGSRPILMKQKNYSLYHPSAHAIANTVTSVPVNLFITIIFVVVLYFLSNLAREAGKFFICLLFIFLLSLTMSAMFNAISSINKTISAANGMAGILVLATLMYSSYMIQRPSMHPWFKWISYIDPLLYAFEAIIATEFHGRKMACDGSYLIPSGPDYANAPNSARSCAFVGSEPGQTWVDGDRYLKVAYTYSFTHVWRNFGILIGFLAFFLFINAVGVEYIRPISGGGDRLIYLRGKVPDTVVLPSEKNPEDIESNGTAIEKSNSLEKISENGDSNKKDEALQDLKSKDLFVWKNVDYVIQYDGNDRKLLDSVSGYCIPGTLTALMGESGAGKTTLLNTLAQRIDTGVVTGDMLVNGKPLDMSFSRRTGYVQQQDIHVSETTVREALVFAARLRRSNDVSDAEKVDYVEKIIEVLDMGSYADAIVGQLGSGLNVEQRKKLSIGVELVAKPSLLLFLDEPTSGLDSQSAWAIVKLLRELAAAGQSILCTIHQPSATLFEEFDRLLLLRKGGQTVYFGDIGRHSRVILDYFERNGARHCNDNENPAEYILEAIGAGATAVVDRDWFQIWQDSPENAENMRVLEQLLEDSSKNGNSDSLSKEEIKQLLKPYATPVYYQFWHVLYRNALMFWRNPEYLVSKLGLMTVAGLFIGFTFFGLKHSVTGMQNGMFASFLAVVVSAPVINQIQEQAIKGRDIFEGREKLSKTYHWSLMMLSQFLNEIPYIFFAAAVMFVSLYFPTQADTSGPHAGVFYLTQGIFVQLYILSFGLLLLYIAPNLESAAVLVSFFYTFIVAFSGVVQPTSLMPGFWTFMYKVSPYTYLIQNLISSILHDREVKCAETELAIFRPPDGKTCQEYAGDFVKKAGGYLDDPSSTTLCGYCQYKVADEYLATIGAKYSYRWRNIGFYFVYIIFDLAFVLILYWLIRYRKGSLLAPIKNLIASKKRKN
ncbi:hypothetical protein HYPBUDRAFT_112819 [Hyphopichia burtonii NRRL Y-1933]|uniref:ABC transporter domain-containing protein n=1 Tax=Hyphopichia burtonii NRRL Y-1933 TaxID=984485 RepID=A0A1E4RF37_9ASCO|nr:hypothetical protein HYPBUDRAFT_112819 [Hyphopichia burtonii NRRL Y-1933]ODV65879.1 hypothetical protein HYPBUDRAFT_112819 [Hyphopichia burtonii NRRL Y-1933]